MARLTGEWPQDTYEHIDHEEALLGGHLARLQKVQGYKASAIMTFRGDVLASHSADPRIDLLVVGRIFNDIFRAAHEAAEKIDLSACLETVINTPKGVIVMRCSGLDAAVHFHLLAVLAADGNLALTKMELEKMTAPILSVLS